MSDIATTIRVGELRNFGTSSMDVMPPMNETEVAQLEQLGQVESDLQPGETWTPGLSLAVPASSVETVTADDGESASRITVCRSEMHNGTRHAERVRSIATAVAFTLYRSRGTETEVESQLKIS
jgi:hypothetical protein